MLHALRLTYAKLYVYDHVLMHVHALTSSLRAASAPSDTSCATVPARPFSLAQCKAERIPYLSCKDTHTSTSVPCAPPPTPLPLPLPPPPLPPALIPLPRSRSACSFATAPDPPPCPHPSHHTPSLTRLVRYLQVQGARELGRLHQLRRRSLVLVGARQPQGRAAVLYVCVRKCVTSCMRVRGGGAGGRQQRKGKERVIRGNVYSIVVSRVHSRGEIETTRVPTQPAWFLSSAGEAGSQPASIQPNV